MSAHNLDVWMLFLERLGCTLTSLWYLFYFLFVRDSDWLQGGVSDTVVSSTTSKSISESSNSDRIWRPRGGVKLVFSKTFRVWWFKNTAISCKQKFMFAIKQTSQCQERKFIIFLDSLSTLLVQKRTAPFKFNSAFFSFLFFFFYV